MSIILIKLRRETHELLSILKIKTKSKSLDEVVNRLLVMYYERRK